MNELLVVTPNGYKTSKLYSVVPADGTGDLTWVRNTTATRVNSSGLIESVGANVPRLDYSGGVTCPCILVEPQRTNLLLYSEEFNNAYWTKNSVTVSSDSTASPDSNITADKMVEGAVSSAHWAFRSITGAYTSLTSSCYFKKAEREWALIRVRTSSGDRYAYFNLTSGTIGTVQSPLTASIEYVGNGWYRCEVTTLSPTAAANPIVFGMSTADNTITYLGDGTSGLYIWGAQLEEASTVSSYIPTTSSTQTRNADVATVTTPAGITSLIETYEDNTTNVVNPIPVTYQMSEGRIAKVVGL